MPAKPATTDICLVLEGTYPYVAGGVSTWVHQIINMFPDWTFSLFYLGAQKDPKAKYKYQLPPNVKAVEEVYLFDQCVDGGLLGGVGGKWKPFYENVRKLGVRLPVGDRHDLDLVRGLLKHVGDHSRVGFESFWKHPETWNVAIELYDRYAPDESFLDFYWTLRFLIQPVWKLARAMNRLPQAKVYHTACTGYAGLAAAMAAAETGKPMVLTEHGIYLRERIADICRSPWIPDQLVRRPNLDEPLGTLRRLWIGFFDVIGRMAYHQSTDIVSLFGKNADAQIHFGADPAKITIIPNGIKTEEFFELKKKRDERRSREPGSQVVGFLGRVVSIKDVKTLLRTARKVCDVLPKARFLVAGPHEEEPEYYRECVELMEQLGVQDQVKFLGPTQRNDFLPQLDVMILSSISEGLPFVIIESLAAGVPVVSTDVGACSELLNGRPGESPAFGPAGLIAEIANSDELAAHLIRVLTDHALLDQMTASGLRRVETLYHENAIRDAYHELYAKHLT
ncbi:MAG: GT4 family glycosyltransferase PelF [Verrucomicrobiaceae bacterium]|nr:GT4 family glycosyltransferase PelF [Verrucomicrobiaceae bacterium]